MKHRARSEDGHGHRSQSDDPCCGTRDPAHRRAVLDIDDAMRGRRSPEGCGGMTLVDESSEAVPAALRRLMAVLAGAAPLSAVEESFAATFQLHMGFYSTRATATDWKRWVRFMRETGRIEDLRLELLDIEPVAGCWLANACWTGLARGSPDRVIRRSERLSVRYRLQDGKIAELWTVPRNYVLILGPLMKFTPGFLLILLWFRRWCARQEESLS